MNLDEITYRINGAVFEVHNTLGAGFLEKVYENALLVELRRLGLKTQNQEPIKISYKGQIVGEYFADVLVEDCVIVELKTVERFEKIHEAQLLNYLKSQFKRAFGRAKFLAGWIFQAEYNDGESWNCEKAAAK